MIEVQLQQEQFIPDEDITGEVLWSDLKPTDSIEIRLIWYTAGKGTRDIEVTYTNPITSVVSTGNETFNMTAPSYPYSFSGKLVSLIWAVEAVVLPSRDAATVPIVISPNRQEVLIARHALDD